MMLLRNALLTAFILLPVSAMAASLCAPLTGASSVYYTNDTQASQNCNVIITINATGPATFTVVNSSPYDGNDDNYVGIINNSAAVVNSVTITGTTDLFGFDGDGIDGYGITGNSIDIAAFGTSAYGGPNAYFTNRNANNSTGTVNFIGGLAANGGRVTSRWKKRPPQPRSGLSSPTQEPPNPAAWCF